MDPDEKLEELREIIRSFRDGYEDPLEAADQMASYFEELDEYLCRKGHLPEDWKVSK